jgi:bisphosphoglycerate-dependent phosphoglycerate mutase
LDKLTKEQVLELNIATGPPIVYELDERGTVLKKTVHELPPAK